MAVRLLLDARAFVWAVMQPAQLSRKARTLLENPDNALVVSAASAGESATKFRLGKSPGAVGIVGGFDEVVRRPGADSPPVSHLHALLAGSCPLPHRDPFDRVLAAQSEMEGLPLVSKDRALRQFGVELAW